MLFVRFYCQERESICMKIVDESNPMPKYLQISGWLKELIETGRYKKGEKLPSEIEFKATFDR